MKAISEKSSMLIAMIIFRARFTALTGYGIGVGLCTALIGVAKLRLPSYAVVINFWNLGIGLVIVLLIVAASSHIRGGEGFGMSRLIFSEGKNLCAVSRLLAMRHGVSPMRTFDCFNIDTN